MKCFHFTNGERRDDEDGVVSRVSKVSWARSLSVASSSVDNTRRSEFDSDSRDLSDSVSFYEFLSLRRANDLRVFTFLELKSATRGFSRALMIGEGGFGCVYRGMVRVPEDEITDGSPSKMDVAIKQLNRITLMRRILMSTKYDTSASRCFNGNKLIALIASAWIRRIPASSQLMAFGTEHDLDTCLSSL
ncbi:hypothetical protein FNV43_RR05144 [Rhamnella rubrinervis]|uniref:Protein kinase n=1 Tax=Rhamnella rubrinervis TaxID=2594499 RepID=A0A8K0HKT9_9ROSA|nr:hypothetical protein FNV43_RR05144 [Rhamnella rubrinervis]